MAYGKTNFLGKLMVVGAIQHGGLMSRSYQGRGSFTNALSSNLKAVNLKMNHSTVYRIMEGIILQVSS